MSETVNQNQNTEQGTETENKNNNTENRLILEINTIAIIPKIANNNCFEK